jgi:hypothetical protein
MIEQHPEHAKRLQDALVRITKLNPGLVAQAKQDVSETEKIDKLVPGEEKDSSRMRAIALSAFSRAMAGLRENKDSPLRGRPDLLGRCFLQYVAFTKGLSQKQIEQIIEAMVENSDEGWQALFGVVDELVGPKADQKLAAIFRAAVTSVVRRKLPEYIHLLQENPTNVQNLRSTFRLFEIITKINPAFNGLERISLRTKRVIGATVSQALLQPAAESEGVLQEATQHPSSLRSSLREYFPHAEGRHQGEIIKAMIERSDSGWAELSRVLENPTAAPNPRVKAKIQEGLRSLASTESPLLQTSFVSGAPEERARALKTAARLLAVLEKTDKEFFSKDATVRELKLAIARGIVSGNLVPPLPDELIQGSSDRPSLLSQCLEAYFRTENLTQEALEQNILGLMSSSFDIWDAALQAMEKVVSDVPSAVRESILAVANGIVRKNLPANPQELQGPSREKLEEFSPEMCRTLELCEVIKDFSEEARKRSSGLKCVIAQLVIDRARAREKAPLQEDLFQVGYSRSSLLTSCFEEFLVTEGLSQEALAQTIEDLIANGDDDWEALLQALKNQIEKNAQPGLREKIQKAVTLIGHQWLETRTQVLQQSDVRDLGESLRVLDRVYSMFLVTQTPLEVLGPSARFVERFYERLFKEEPMFSLTLSRPKRQLLSSAKDQGIGVECASWANSCASVPIHKTFGRLSGIQIGDQKVGHAQGQSVGDMIQVAYVYNRALVKYLEENGVADPEKVANELMLRSSGDATMNQFFYPLSSLTSVASPSPAGQNVQQPSDEVVAVRVIKPEQQTYRFSVQDGRCIIERMFPLQRTVVVDGARQRNFAWVECRTEFDPKAPGDKWVERVMTKPYGIALAEEVRRRTSPPMKTQEQAVAEVQKDLEDQVYGMGSNRKESPDRKAEVTALLKEMNEALERPPQ